MTRITDILRGISKSQRDQIERAKLRARNIEKAGEAARQVSREIRGEKE